MNVINPCKSSLIPYKESLPKLALLVTGVALTVLGSLQLGLLLNLGSISGWAFAGPGLGLLSILAVDLIAIKIQEKLTESQLEVLRKKNEATHIPSAEFRELVAFLQIHSPEMRTAIEEGFLLEQAELDLSFKGLTELPNSLGHLINLTLLNVTDNQLTALPSGIEQLTNLTELYAFNNQLTALPDTIGQLTSLTQLNVYNNQLTALPDTIGQLTNLTHLYVNNNQLTVLSSSIGDLSSLRVLQVHNNLNLSAFPLSLGNCSQLTYFSITGTRIPQSNRAQILATCRNMRNLEAAEKFPHKIKLWRKFADIVEEWVGPEFTEEQKGHLYEWLFRLEKARDFERYQKELAETTCAILETVHTDAEFRKTFFNLIAADLIACGDRAAMSLNLVYTDWKLYTLPAEASLSEKVQLLVGCGRALKLRQAVLGRYPGYENVEKVLYAEVNLRERLGLVTAITSMIYSEIGHVEGSMIEDIAQKIEAISDAELIVEFAYWENYLKEHHASEFSKIKDEIQKARDTLLTSLESDEIKEGEYQSRDKELQVQEQEAILQLTQKIIDGIS